MTSITDLHWEWMKDPDYRSDYERPVPEFELARTLITARTRAGLTQEQLARRMETTQAVARLEGGRVLPTTRALQRFAEATGTRLWISFEPAETTASP